MVAAGFQHETSRALDPHLHTHCIVFNATHDPEEGRWKALQQHQMLVAQKYVENVYYHELARDLIRSGYEIESRARGDFEIAGVSTEVCERFSKRHGEIDARTMELLAKLPEKAAMNINEIRDHIAHNERSRKMKNMKGARLRKTWSEQLAPSERAALDQLVAHAMTSPGTLRAGRADLALQWAEDHLFERKSVVHEHELWRHALVHARGENLSIENLHAATAEAAYLRDERHPEKITTRETLGREWEILCRVKEGVGRFQQFTNSEVATEALDEEQARAVKRILGSRDLVTLFRGGAGTGKSFALRAVRSQLDAGGHHTCVIAPQRQQVIDLERDGFQHTQTVTEFLTRRDAPSGAVVILDEAGQLGAKQMKELLDYIVHIGGRLIASGDTRQHGAVEASDALRAIEKYSGVTAAELHSIRRQDATRARSETERSFIEQYKSAVSDAACGRVAEAFDRLDENGAVVECTMGNQQQLLAAHYLDLAQAGESAIVVSQTWDEIRHVNDVVRDGLKSRGMLGVEECEVAALDRIDLTDAQKRDPQFFDRDSVIVLNRPCAGFEKGTTGAFIGITAKGMVVEVDGRIGCIPGKHLDRVTVCRSNPMTLAAADRVQLKANAQVGRGQRVANGEIVSVLEVSDNGAIKLLDGRTLPPNYRQFVRGYAVTSYGSQGKTVDHVIFSDSAAKAATNRQQWYVTMSRGRRGIRIFTADKAQLRENIARCGDRELALDMHRSPLARSAAVRNRFFRHGRRGRGMATVLWNAFRHGMSRRRKAVHAEVNL